MNKKIFFCITILLCVSFIPITAMASSIRLEPQEYSIGLEGSFSVSVILEADNDINAVSASILFSKGLEPIDVNESNSIINMWIEKPTWNEDNKTLSFSGIIPGGYNGRGHLLDIKIDAKNLQGDADLAFDSSVTKAFLNDADATLEKLSLGHLKLPFVSGKENIPVILPDTNIPESFSPEIANDESLFGGGWFVTFYTSDKGSGMLRYEVAERRGMPIDKYDKLNWKETQSPYLLKDQSLASSIYIRAVDKAGNNRVETIPPSKNVLWYENLPLWIIIFIVLLVFISWKIWKKRSLNESF